MSVRVPILLGAGMFIYTQFAKMHFINSSVKVALLADSGAKEGARCSHKDSLWGPFEV